VTHPFHPLRGREFEVVDVRNTWGEWRVYVSDGTGQLMRLPTAWTDWAEPDLFQTVSAGRSPLHVEALRRLVELVAGLEEAGGCQGNDAGSGRGNLPDSEGIETAQAGVSRHYPT
jgi:hypothetical protein